MVRPKELLEDDDPGYEVRKNEQADEHGRQLAPVRDGPARHKENAVKSQGAEIIEYPIRFHMLIVQCVQSRKEGQPQENKQRGANRPPGY